MAEHGTSRQRPPEPISIRDDRVELPRWRRRQPARRQSKLGLNLTAMIDVVFLLLIFFMVATKFRLGEEIYRLDLPERGEAQAADPFRLDLEPLRIGVNSIGRGAQAYRIELDGPYDDLRSFEELYIFLRDRQIAPGRASGLFEPDHPIIVEPTPTARWDHVMGAFNAAARARYTNVTFAAAGASS